jgi:hypothetical protein
LQLSPKGYINQHRNITGLVTDASGAPVGSAPVNVTNNDTNTATHVVTTSTGEYNVPNLTPGTYRVEVTAPGFKTFLVDRLTLTAGATVRTDAQLRVGQLSESVEVTAQAIQTQTEDAKISSAVQNKLVDELPLVVGGALRSPFDLVTTVLEAKGSGNALSLGGGQAASCVERRLRPEHRSLSEPSSFPSAAH